MGLMDGKVGLVTGAGSGIGRASALAFAAEGARVVVSDIGEAGGSETVNMIERAGGQAAFVRCDVAAESDVSMLVSATVERFGRLDWAHNNAGIEGATAPITEQTFESSMDVLRVDLVGVLLCMKHEIAQMLSQSDGGAIVNTASTAGLRGEPSLSPYVAAKWGVNGLTKTAAVEFGERGIRVNSVCPTWTLTPAVEQWVEDFPEQAAAAGAAIPLRRMARPEEQARIFVWLCSDQASYVTGVNLPADGGTTAG